jgi:hypothetical protein
MQRRSAGGIASANISTVFKQLLRNEKVAVLAGVVERGHLESIPQPTELGGCEDASRRLVDAVYSRRPAMVERLRTVKASSESENIVDDLKLPTHRCDVKRSKTIRIARMDGDTLSYQS